MSTLSEITERARVAIESIIRVLPLASNASHLDDLHRFASKASVSGFQIVPYSRLEYNQWLELLKLISSDLVAFAESSESPPRCTVLGLLDKTEEASNALILILRGCPAPFLSGLTGAIVDHILEQHVDYVPLPISRSCALPALDQVAIHEMIAQAKRCTVAKLLRVFLPTPAQVWWLGRCTRANASGTNAVTCSELTRSSEAVSIPPLDCEECDDDDPSPVPDSDHDAPFPEDRETTSDGSCLHLFERGDLYSGSIIYTAVAVPAETLKSVLLADFDGADVAIGEALASLRCASISGSSAGSLLTDAVPLVSFERFVACFAEPSAQAAWHLMAERIARDAVSIAFDAVLRTADYEGPRASSEPDAPYKRNSPISSATLNRLHTAVASGKLAHTIGSSVSALLLPFATALVGSALSGFAYGGCAGAWAAFLPKALAEEFLRASGPGHFLLRFGHPGEIIVSYATSTHALDDTGSVNSTHVAHELLVQNEKGNEFVLRGVAYASIGCAVVANSFLKQPCLAASLAIVGWALPPHVTQQPTTLGEVSPTHSPASVLAAVKNEDTLARIAEDKGSPLSYVGSGLGALMDVLAGSSWRVSLGFSEVGVLDAPSSPHTFTMSAPADVPAPINVIETTMEGVRCALGSTLGRTPLPGFKDPAGLLATAWSGPLPVPEPHILPAAAVYSSSNRSTPRRYGFAGYHGVIPFDKTLDRLAGKPPGSYLVRASHSQRNSSVLAFVDATGCIQQSIVAPDPLDYRRASCSGHSFASLQAVIQAYSTPPSAPPGSSALLRIAVPPASDKIKLRRV